jgi:hypothetical protein
MLILRYMGSVMHKAVRCRRVLLGRPMGMRFLVFSTILVITGCEWSAAIWIVPGSTANHLVFRVGRWHDDYKPIVVRYIAVFQRTDSMPETRWIPRWRIFMATPSRIKQIEYGTTQFASVPSSLPAQPLTPGYYEVSVSFDKGTKAETDFTITTNGAVVEHRLY